MMSGTYLLIQIAGSAALMLWGIRMARTAVMRAHGAQIRRVLPGAFKNRIVSLVAGVGAAAVLQSSTAVAVFIASFAGMGVVPISGGLALMLGADIGSAVVAALLTLNLKGVWPLLILIGYVVHAMYERSASRAKQHGRFALGIGVVLISLIFMSQVSSRLAENSLVRLLLGSLAGEPVIAVLLIAVLTWLAHSSISILLLVASLVEAGIISDTPLMLAAVLGINLGGGVPAIVLTWGQAPAARRIVVGNGLFRLVGVTVGIVLLDHICRLYDFLPGEPGFRIVLLHIVFNICLASGFIGIVGRIAPLLERLVHEPPASPEETFGPRYIPPISGAFQAALPLSALTREILRMADVVQSMITQTADLLGSRSTPPKQVEGIRRLDDKVDTLYRAIRGYAVDLTRSDLEEGELQRVNILLRYALNLENIGDIIDKSLLDITAQKSKRHRCFSHDGNTELDRLFRHASDSMQMSADVAMGWKCDTAETLSHRKNEFKTMARDSADRHLERLRQGVSDSLETSSYHMDIINDLLRINSLIASLAVDVLSCREPAGKFPADVVGKSS